MSERKRPPAEEAMARLLVDDAEQYERMLEEGHRELCLEYQPLLPAIVDAAVVGRQLDGRLKEARDYLKECPICAESLESSSKALREIQEELEDVSLGDPPSPQPVVPPAEPQPEREPGKVGRWWSRWSRTRSAMIVTVGVLLCAVALVGFVVHFFHQCSVDEAKRDRADAAVHRVPSDAAVSAMPPDARVDPRSWLRHKGPLGFVFVNLEMVRKQHGTVDGQLREVEQRLAKLAKGRPTRAEVAKLRRALDLDSKFLTPLESALKRAEAFLAKVKDDGMTPGFAKQLEEVKKLLRARRQTQAALAKRHAAAVKLLNKLVRRAHR